MPVQRATFTRPLIAVAMVAASTLYAVAQRAPVPTRVRGTIESVNGDTMQVGRAAARTSSFASPLT